jgi:hypothetical protein
MNAFRSSLVLLAVCSLFVGSVIRADECSDSLIAESCACRSHVRSEGEQFKSSDKGRPSATHSKAGKGARIQLSERAKRPLASTAAASPD